MYRRDMFLVSNIIIIMILMMCKVQITESQMKSKFDVVHVNDIYGSLDFVPGMFTHLFHHTYHSHSYSLTHTHTHTHTHPSTTLFTLTTHTHSHTTHTHTHTHTHTGEDLFGHEIRYSEKEKADKRLFEAKRRRETLWKLSGYVTGERERGTEHSNDV